MTGREEEGKLRYDESGRLLRRRGSTSLDWAVALFIIGSFVLALRFPAHVAAIIAWGFLIRAIMRSKHEWENAP